MPLTPGSDFGPFRVVEPLGKGGMSSVYRAWERTLEREIALKVLPPQFLHDPSFSERFEREAKVVARLEHRNIVPIHAFGVDEETPWMAMRLVAGESAAGLLADGPIAPERVIAILREVGEAIDYAHSRGVLHRDVKPQNILLDQDGHAYLCDFGIARIVAGDGESTQTGTIMGTPKYMAPEQARGEAIDHRCDIYSLGVVAYELFTGSVPFSGTTPMNIAVKHIMDPVPAPDPALLARPLAEPVLKCLAKYPGERWSSAIAFVDALAAGLKEIRSLAAEPRASQAPTQTRPPRSAALSPPPPAPPTPPRPTPAPQAEERPAPHPGTPRPRRAGTTGASPRLAAALGVGALALLVVGGLAALRAMRSPVGTAAPPPSAAADTTPVAADAALPAAAADAPSAPPSTVAAAASATASSATLELFQRVCDDGDATGCEKVALAYREGQGGPEGRARAAELFAKACDGGAATSCAFLAGLYRDGDGVLRNLARAVALFDQACEAGAADGCYGLGLLYRSGEGVRADEARARELLARACQAGSAEACAAMR